MSAGNYIGNFGQITDFDNIVVDNIQSRSEFQTINIRNDMDLLNENAIAGATSVATASINSLNAPVAELSVDKATFVGDVSVNGTLSVSGSSFIGVVSAEGGVNVSGGDLQIGATSQIVFDTSSVRMGVNAGTESQGDNAVAVGHKAGESTQGDNAVAVGHKAGENTQGDNAVAIGALAGESNQHNNTIVLNATVSSLDTDGTDRLFIKPVRGVAHGLGVGVMVYDPTTGEITYSTD